MLTTKETELLLSPAYIVHAYGNQILDLTAGRKRNRQQTESQFLVTVTMHWVFIQKQNCLNDFDESIYTVPLPPQSLPPLLFLAP